MSTRYVVVANAGDALRVFGTYRDHERATALAEKINTEVVAREDADFAEWQKRYAAGEVSYTYGSPEDMAPEGYGRAHVYIVHRPRYREGLAFALSGNPDPAYARKGA